MVNQTMTLIVLLMFLRLCDTRGLAVAGGDHTPPATAMCGINAIYIYIHLAGKGADHRELSHLLGGGLRAVSFLELRDVAVSHGVPSEVRRFSPAHLTQIKTPFIARVESKNHETGGIGHFVVVFAATDQSVEFADGTTGEVFNWPPLWFNNMWRGEVLVTNQVRASLDNWLTVTAVLMVITLLLPLFRHIAIFISFRVWRATTSQLP